MTDQEIIELNIRFRDLSGLDHPTRSQYQELEAVRGAIWGMTGRERRIGLEGLWALDGIEGDELAECRSWVFGDPVPPEVAARIALKPRAIVSGWAMAEIGAACEIEGTPLAPIAAHTRAIRTCVECGSPVHGDHCAHCFEG